MGLFGNLFGKPDHTPDPTYNGLRQQILQIRPEDIGLRPRPDEPIFGVMMETGMGKDIATFLCLADGTVSLYLSTGGGVIGAGEHEPVRSAAGELLQITNKYALDYISAASPGLLKEHPKHGQVHFVLLTYSGIHSVVCEEKALAEYQDPFANLFANCHAVLAELREATESSRDSQTIWKK
jgi:hypothetical protein